MLALRRLLFRNNETMVNAVRFGESRFFCWGDARETHVRPYELRVNIVKTNQRIVCVTCEIEKNMMYKRVQ